MPRQIEVYPKTVYEARRRVAWPEPRVRASADKLVEVLNGIDGVRVLSIHYVHDTGRVDRDL